MDYNKKGQSSSEFFILVGAVVVFLISLFIVINMNMQEKFKEENTLRVQKLAEQIQKEIYLAETASTGYKRVFNLPTEIANRKYNVTFLEKQVYIATVDEKYAISLPISNVNGTIKIGNNIIEKREGGVYLNGI